MAHNYAAPHKYKWYVIGPLLNAEQIALQTHPRYEMFLYDYGWGKNDKSDLLEAMKSIMIEEKMVNITLKYVIVCIKMYIITCI